MNKNITVIYYQHNGKLHVRFVSKLGSDRCKYYQLVGVGDENLFDNDLLKYEKILELPTQEARDIWIKLVENRFEQPK